MIPTYTPPSADVSAFLKSSDPARITLWTDFLRSHADEQTTGVFFQAEPHPCSRPAGMCALGALMRAAGSSQQEYENATYGADPKMSTDTFFAGLLGAVPIDEEYGRANFFNWVSNLNDSKRLTFHQLADVITIEAAR